MKSFFHLPRPRLLLAVFLLAAVSLGWASVSSAREKDVLRDVVYGKAGDKDLKLDLYLPINTLNARPRPVIIFLHGGGWRVGGKKEAEPYASLITTAGFFVASVDYRLSGNGRFPAQIFDAKTAVRWVRANAAKYGMDPKSVGVLGLSAGGHLAALLGTSEGVESLEDRGEGSPDASSRVQAVCSVSGPTDLTLPPRSLVGKLSITGLLGGSAAQKPELARSGDPVGYVTKDDAPTLLIHGDKDTLVPPIHARRFAEALHKAGVETKVIIVQGGNHVPFEERQQQAALEFFGQHLNRP